MTIVAPKNRANTTSLTRPRILDKNVIELTTEVDLSRCPPDSGCFEAPESGSDSLAVE
jgi:hypothetical protein